VVYLTTSGRCTDAQAEEMRPLVKQHELINGKKQ